MKKVIFFLFLFAGIYANAQQFTVSGTVFDENNQPLEGATVKLNNSTFGTTTDGSGKYQLSLTSGNYVLEAQFLGYATTTKEISLSSDLRNINFNLLPNATALEEISVRSFRVNAEAPITHSNLSKQELKKRNLGQDVATQIKFLPNIVTTSDAGAGIGYTGFRVRGTGNQGINVTINGIPYNDAESATSFFVNLQDFTSSVENLQLQRGVGTSTNGPGAFGASLNILTDNISEEAYASTSHSFGSFNTIRNNVKFSTGLLNEHFEISGRVSRIKSDAIPFTLAIIGLELAIYD